MLDISQSIRLWITVTVLLGAFILLHTVSHGETIILRHPLLDISYTLGPWTGEEHPLQERVTKAIGVSDYTNRIYAEQESEPVQLYIGYYASQKTGDTIHSPKNCLPGAGWEPIHSGHFTMTVQGGRQIVVNEYVVQRDLNKQMVFYWYQGRGRVIASEYWGKFWMVADAISRNRTDGALVRVITPANDGEERARARLVRFTQVLFPHLESVLPN
jgi:EpsI family protein